jgi:hypothetical protein
MLFTSPLEGEVDARSAAGGEGAKRLLRRRHPLPNPSPVEGEGLELCQHQCHGS